MLVMKKEYQSAASLRRITYTVTCEDKVMTRSGSFRGDSLSWDNKLYMRLKCLCTQYKSAVIPNEVKSSSQPCCNYVLVIIILAFCCLLSGFLILKCKKKSCARAPHHLCQTYTVSGLLKLRKSCKVEMYKIYTVILTESPEYMHKKAPHLH